MVSMVSRALSLSPQELFAPSAHGGIGLVVPFDFALDAECWRWTPPGVSLYVTRTPRQDAEVTVTLAERVSEHAVVADGVRNLLAAAPASVAYACTSGSFIHGLSGELRLHDVMREAGAPATVTTSGAMLEAFQTLGARRVAIATPYDEMITAGLSNFLEQAGHEVVSSAYLGLTADIAKVGPGAVRYLAHAVEQPDVDAYFFSCTNLRTFDVIRKLETELDRPVLSANQVTVWSALRAGGFPMPDVGHRLFDVPAPVSEPTALTEMFAPSA